MPEEVVSIMPESISAVWTAVSGFFTTGLSAAISVITDIPVLCAPLIIWVAAKVLGQGKGLFKLGGRRR